MVGDSTDEESVYTFQWDGWDYMLQLPLLNMANSTVLINNIESCERGLYVSVVTE